MKYDVIILTQDIYIDPKEVDWYVEQVLTEDELVQKALEAKGLKVTKKDWADPDFDWSTATTILFRSTWDYFHRFSEFTAWLNRISGKVKLINPESQIRWNIDKHYLLDLEKKGIPVVESHFIPKGSTQKLKEIHEELNWTETVVKPTVSGGGRHTYRLNPGNYAEHEELFADLIKEEDFILQPFQHNIIPKGEVSHMVFGGKYTHSILKIAKEGDYRVQDDFGGSIHMYAASPEEREFAEQVAKACEPLPAYARVDVIWDNNDELAVGEVELIEPELWFRKNHKAADALAEVIFDSYFKN